MSTIRNYKKASVILTILLFILSLVLFTLCTNTTEDQSGPKIEYYTCGMHPSVKADEPGKCPICNMDLVPVYQEEHKHEDAVDYYTCGMHPSVKADEPGKCPICNMDLVPVHKKETETETERETPVLKASRHAQQLAGVAADVVSYRHLHKQIRTVGQIVYDERAVSRVSAWIPGRIDKLFIDYTGQTIKEGDALALMYSPELVSTQKEYILTLEAVDRSGEQNDYTHRLANATWQRLLLWGVSEDEIARLEKERRVKEHITITAPIGGTVVEKTAQEGQYVKEGQNLYTVADLSRLWIQADVYEYEMGWIREGQNMTVTSGSFPGKSFEGEVLFVDPVLHTKTRSVRIRGDMDNTRGRLRPGMFVDVVIEVHLDKTVFPGMEGVFNDHGGVLSVPVSAVIHTGERKIVYQEVREGEYAGRNVEIGPRAGEYYPLLKGLNEGDRVVLRGNFLIDSQTQLTGLESAVYDAALGEKESKTHQHQHE